MLKQHKIHHVFPPLRLSKRTRNIRCIYNVFKCTGYNVHGMQGEAWSFQVYNAIIWRGQYERAMCNTIQMRNNHNKSKRLPIPLHNNYYKHENDKRIQERQSVCENKVFS